MPHLQEAGQKTEGELENLGHFSGLKQHRLVPFFPPPEKSFRAILKYLTGSLSLNRL